MQALGRVYLQPSGLSPWIPTDCSGEEIRLAGYEGGWVWAEEALIDVSHPTPKRSFSPPPP